MNPIASLLFRDDFQRMLPSVGERYCFYLYAHIKHEALCLMTRLSDTVLDIDIHDVSYLPVYAIVETYVV